MWLLDDLIKLKEKFLRYIIFCEIIFIVFKVYVIFYKFFNKKKKNILKCIIVRY